MISRVAESCFWLNRYVERVETLARILDVNLSFQLDVNLPAAERWRPLVVVTGQEKHFLEETHPDEVDDPETVQRYLTFAEDNPSSILSSLAAARENARTIRETVSLEMWEILNDVWLWLGDRSARKLYEKDRHAFYLRLRNQCLLFHGASHATMLHEDPFEFMRLGTAIERAEQTTRLLDVKYHSVGPTEAGSPEMPYEAAQWLATLRFCSGVEPFFKRSENTLSGPSVARFLLFDRAFPRSVLHNLLRAVNFLSLVRPPRPTRVGERSARQVDRLLEEVSALSIDAAIQWDLHEVVTRIVAGTHALSRTIRAEFFDPALPGGSAEQVVDRLDANA